MHTVAVILVAGAYVAFVAFEAYLFGVNRRTFRIPDRVLLTGAAVAAALLVPAALIDGQPIRIAGAVVGAAAAFATFVVPHLAWPRAVGFGNVKDGAYVGLHLGFAAAGVGSAAAVAAVASVFAVAFAAAFLFVRLRITHNNSAFATTTAPWMLIGLLPTVLLLKPFT